MIKIIYYLSIFFVTFLLIYKIAEIKKGISKIDTPLNVFTTE